MPTTTKRSKAAAQPSPGDPGEIDATALQLKRRREELGLSVVELHKTTGIARTALHDYEAGRYKPGLTEIRKLCDALKITPNRLVLGRDDVEKPPSAIEEMLGAGPEALKMMKVMRMVFLLPEEERDALTTLVMGLVTSRYPRARVDKELESVELLYGVTNAMAAVRNMKPGEEINQEFVEEKIREVAPDLVSEERRKRVEEERSKSKKPAK